MIPMNRQQMLIQKGSGGETNFVAQLLDKTREIRLRANNTWLAAKLQVTILCVGLCKKQSKRTQKKVLSIALTGFQVQCSFPFRYIPLHLFFFTLHRFCFSDSLSIFEKLD